MGHPSPPVRQSPDFIALFILGTWRPAWHRDSEQKPGRKRRWEDGRGEGKDSQLSHLRCKARPRSSVRGGRGGHSGLASPADPAAAGCEEAEAGSALQKAVAWCSRLSPLAHGTPAPSASWVSRTQRGDTGRGLLLSANSAVLPSRVLVAAIKVTRLLRPTLTKRLRGHCSPPLGLSTQPRRALDTRDSTRVT